MNENIVNIFKSYPQCRVLQMYKWVEHYWDCCIVGYVMHSLLSGFLDGVTFILSELIKFGVVLFLTYMLALFIFYLWERNLAAGGSSSSFTQPVPLRSDSYGNTNYPFVVELPTKASHDSVKDDQTAKGNDKRKSTESTKRKSGDGEAGKSSNGKARKSGDAEVRKSAEPEARKSAPEAEVPKEEEAEVKPPEEHAAKSAPEPEPEPESEEAE